MYAATTVWLPGCSTAHSHKAGAATALCTMLPLQALLKSTGWTEQLHKIKAYCSRCCGMHGPAGGWGSFWQPTWAE